MNDTLPMDKDKLFYKRWSEILSLQIPVMEKSLKNIEQWVADDE